LKSVVDKVLTFTQQEAEAFLADINGSTCTTNYLCDNVSQIDVSIVNAWKYIVDAMNTGTKRTAFAQDFPLINKVKEITSDASTNQIFDRNARPIQNGTILTFTQFLSTHNNVYCNTCGTPRPTSGYQAWFPKLDEILNNTVATYRTFNSSTGFTNVFFSEAFAKDAPWTRDGSQHMLRALQNGIVPDPNSPTVRLTFSTANVDAFDQQFGGTVSASSEFDLKLKNNPNILFVEFKSYQEDTDLSTKGVSQFLGYLNNITSLSQLRYVFNEQKIDRTQAKQKMQAVFQGTKANDIFNLIYPKMASSLGLSANPVSARQQYNALINNLDDKIFSFVITN
jgi:hypothetical protein